MSEDAGAEKRGHSALEERMGFFYIGEEAAPDGDDVAVVVVCGDENRRVLRILEIAGIDGLIDVHRSREEGLSALAAAG